MQLLTTGSQRPSISSHLRQRIVLYQCTHHTSSTSFDEDSSGDNDDGEAGRHGNIAGLKVAGRMSRNAARVGCIADALFAAELCELIQRAPPASEGLR